MPSYNAVGQVNVAPTPKRTDAWIDALAGYSPAVSRTDDGVAELVITLEAPALEAAAAAAHALLVKAAGQLRALEVMTTEEYDRRTDAIDQEEYVGTTEAAQILGVSRQYAVRLAETRAVPTIRIGQRGIAYPVSALRRRAAKQIRSGKDSAGRATTQVRKGRDEAPTKPAP